MTKNPVARSFRHAVRNQYNRKVFRLLAVALLPSSPASAWVHLYHQQLNHNVRYAARLCPAPWN